MPCPRSAAPVPDRETLATAFFGWESIPFPLALRQPFRARTFRNPVRAGFSRPGSSGGHRIPARWPDRKTMPRARSSMGFTFRFVALGSQSRCASFGFSAKSETPGGCRLSNANRLSLSFCQTSDTKPHAFFAFLQARRRKPATARPGSQGSFQTPGRGGSQFRSCQE